jgi:hypothetical protein
MAKGVRVRGAPLRCDDDGCYYLLLLVFFRRSKERVCLRERMKKLMLMSVVRSSDWTL